MLVASSENGYYAARDMWLRDTVPPVKQKILFENKLTNKAQT